MNLTIKDPWVTIPAAAVYFAVGTKISSYCHTKLLHISEYMVIKKFGDYTNPKKTHNDKIIITINDKYFYAQNIILAGLLASISKVAYPLLVATGRPNLMVIAEYAGLIAGPIIACAVNSLDHYRGTCHSHYVALSEEEVEQHKIDKKQVKPIIGEEIENVYLQFGKNHVRCV